MKNKAIILLIIFSLSLTFAFMHFAFVAMGPGSVRNAYKGQELLVFNPTGREDARILTPYFIYFIHFLIPKDSLPLIIAEAIFAFFSFMAVFLLSKNIIKDDIFSLLAVVGVSIFSPLAFQHAASRFGEVLLIGLYPMLVLLALEKKEILFIIMISIASLQRPEIAICSIVFKLLYNVLDRRNYWMMALNFTLLIVPFAIVGIINYFYDISTAKYIMSEAWRTLNNLKYIWFYALVFSPILILSVSNFKRFGGIVYLMLISLMPYLIAITIAGGFAESRLFLPLATICIIGICSSIKSKGSFTLENLL